MNLASRKPLTISYVQYTHTDSSRAECEAFVGSNRWDFMGGLPVVFTKQGTMLVRNGDYIVMGAFGDITVMSRDRFINEHDVTNESTPAPYGQLYDLGGDINEPQLSKDSEEDIDGGHQTSLFRSWGDFLEGFSDIGSGWD